MTPERLEQYISLTARKRELEADLNAIRDALSALEAALLEEFLALGAQAVKSASGVTVYLHRQLWANPTDGDYDRACQALIAAGLGELVQPRFNTNTLSAWCRERDRAGEELPPSFRDAINVTERVSVRVRT